MEVEGLLAVQQSIVDRQLDLPTIQCQHIQSAVARRCYVANQTSIIRLKHENDMLAFIDGLLVVSHQIFITGNQAKLKNEQVLTGSPGHV